jgi:hypothetical protein
MCSHPFYPWRQLLAKAFPTPHMQNGKEDLPKASDNQSRLGSETLEAGFRCSTACIKAFERNFILWI